MLLGDGTFGSFAHAAKANLRHPLVTKDHELIAIVQSDDLGIRVDQSLRRMWDEWRTSSSRFPPAHLIDSYGIGL